MLLVFCRLSGLITGQAAAPRCLFEEDLALGLFEKAPPPRMLNMKGAPSGALGRVRGGKTRARSGSATVPRTSFLVFDASCE